MSFESRCFKFPKDLAYPNEYEDAFAICAERGVAVVADGVSSSSAFRSGDWANILVNALARNALELTDHAAFQVWLTERRAEWLKAIDYAKLNYLQKRKFEETGGGYSTLLWLQVKQAPSNGEAIAGDASGMEVPPDESPASEVATREMDESAPSASEATAADASPAQPIEGDETGDGRLEASAVEPPAAFQYRCAAIGDCCFFHYRAGQSLDSFPLKSAQDFDLTPATLGSVDRYYDAHGDIRYQTGTCRAGDLLVLTTDALAAWALDQMGRELAVDWDAWWELSDEAWRERIMSIRAADAIRYDDTTLVLLRVGARPAAVACESEAAASDAETPAAELAAAEAPPVELPVTETAVAASPINTAGAIGSNSQENPLPSAASSETDSPLLRGVRSVLRRARSAFHNG